MKRRTFIRNLGLGAALPWLGRAALAAPDAPAKADAPAHTILSCNIRVALREDEAAGNGWRARRKLCLDVIRAQKPDLVCLQEVLREQMDDLARGLPEFASFGFEVVPEVVHRIATSSALPSATSSAKREGSRAAARAAIAFSSSQLTRRGSRYFLMPRGSK